MKLSKTEKKIRRRTKYRVEKVLPTSSWMLKFLEFWKEIENTVINYRKRKNEENKQYI